jgi:hypothetical protein
LCHGVVGLESEHGPEGRPPACRRVSRVIFFRQFVVLAAASQGGFPNCTERGSRRGSE